MSFGWMTVFFGAALMNVYLFYSYYKIQSGKYRRQKIAACIVLHAVLSTPCVYYFYLFFHGRTGSALANALSYEAALFLGLLLYLILLFGVTDLLRLSSRWIRYPQKVRVWARRGLCGGLSLLILSGIIVLPGFQKATEVEIKQYEVSLPRRDSNLSQLRAVLLTDAHLGASVKAGELEEIVEHVNGINPDIVFLGGDFFDEGTPERLKLDAKESLSKLRAAYGTYYIEGNHEYDAGDLEDQMAYFRQAGLNVLTDQTVKVADQFYVVGRKDKEEKREPLNQVMSAVQENLPVIVLDHRPDRKESVESGRVDLQLSGHTHDGQLFPFHILDFVTRQTSYEYHRFGTFQMIVSSGVGTYGVPLRIGSRCEIVDIHIRFH